MLRLIREDGLPAIPIKTKRKQVYKVYFSPFLRWLNERAVNMKMTDLELEEGLARCAGEIVARDAARQAAREAARGESREDGEGAASGGGRGERSGMAAGGTRGAGGTARAPGRAHGAAGQEKAATRGMGNVEEGVAR